MTTPAYPLQWPEGKPRTTKAQRKRATFGKVKTVQSQYGSGSWGQRSELSVFEAIRRLQTEADRLKAKHTVLSTNVELRLDGLPRSNQRDPEDPGAAFYFTLKGRPHCLPCDRWDRVADNIAAIAKHIEATRAIERYGVGDLAAQFTGFLALPPSKRPWRDVLGRGIETLAQAEAVYRSLARERHPDQGGSDAMMAELNVAIADARKELGG